MLSILTNLEPFREGKKIDLVDEFEEFDIIQFVLKGKILVGFTIQHERKFCIKFSDKGIIGAYGATFNKRAAFIYAASTPIEGFFVRKEKWKNALEENASVGSQMKKNIWLNYLTSIKVKINLQRKRACQLLNVREDTQLFNYCRDKKDYLDSKSAWGCSNKHMHRHRE